MFFSLQKSWLQLLLLLFLFLVIKTLFLFKYTGILGGDETYSIFKFIDLWPSMLFGESSLQLKEFLKITQTSPHKLTATILQVPITFFWYKLLPTNEFAAFLGTLTTSTLLVVLLFYSVSYLFNRQVAITTILLYTFSPIGICVATVSSDYAGSIFKLIILMLILYFLFVSSYRKYHRYPRYHRYLGYSLLLLSPFVDPYHLILICSYLLLLILSKGKMFLQVLKKHHHRYLFYLSPLLLLPHLITLQLAYSRKWKQGQRNPFDLSLYWSYLKRSFIGDASTELAAPAWIPQMVLWVFVFIILFFFIRQLRELVRKRMVTFDISNFLAIYCFLFIVIEFLCQTGIRPLSSHPVSVTSNYTQILFLILLIIVAKTSSRGLVAIVCTLNILVMFSTMDKRNNNFVNYNLGNTDYVRNKLGKATPVVFSSMKDYDYYLPIFLGNLSRERNIRVLKSKEDIVKCGMGIQKFYGNSLAVNTCYRFLDQKKIEECQEGFFLEKQQALLR
ncbi:MAG: hypothetical protein HQK51_12795 [Oligoflexia bacterium]|nr:hypothetical protein [Oligoflexia bacterium]